MPIPKTLTSASAKAFAMVVFACVALGSLPSPVAAQDDAADTVIYRVQKDDTLTDIARRFLARTALAHDLQRINRIADPRRLRIDQALRIPRGLLRYDEVPLRVANFSGRVEIAGQPAQVGTIVHEGDLVQTAVGGFVTFTSDGAGRISLPSNSRARLVMARRYVLGGLLDVDFEVLEGRGAFTTPSLREQERFRTRTPAAVTAVRGTQYRISYDTQRALGTTEVTEGGVSVTSGEMARLADAGFGVSARDGAVSEPESLLGAPDMIDPGAIQTGESVEFALEPLAGATGYRVQIARDAGFLDVLDEKVIESETASFDSLENGRYFVRSRGIAESRIEGLSEAISFRRKRLGASASADQSPLGDGFIFGWAAEGEGQVYYAFQLWNMAQPETLLIDDVGLSAERLVITDLGPGRYAWRVAAMQAEPEGLLKIWGPTQELLVSQ